MTKEELLTIANEVMGELSEGSIDLSFETKFDEDLGLDSLEVVEFALQMEDRVGRKIPDRVMDDATTVGDLIEALTIAV